MAIVTNTEVKNHLGETSSDFDTILTTMIAQAQKVQEQISNRAYEQATHTEYFNGELRKIIHVANPPINSVTSVHDDTDRTFGASTLIDSGDYTILSSTNDGKIQFDGILSDGLDNVKVIYSGGWASGSEPVDLKLGVILRTIAIFRMSHVQTNTALNENDRDLEIEKLHEMADMIAEHYRVANHG